ncbi:MAG TPA: YetF domain-containing protein [Gemmatimonadaceae bacterium]|nr:YetF domain-containing protein [Gemmatimonadaceae bacterium]
MVRWTDSCLPATPMLGSSIFYHGVSHLLRSVILAATGFAGLVTMVRIAGKRTLSKFNVYDFVFVVAMGSVLANLILSPDVSLADGLAGMATLIVLQVVVSYASAKWDAADRVINGMPSRVFEHGRYLDRAMKRHRVTYEEVRAAIRQHGLASVEGVDAVVLETDGSLSVVVEHKDGHSSLVDLRDVHGSSRPQ